MTLISASNTTYASSRQVVRDSGSNIIAVLQTTASAIRPYISSDGGSTWTQGDTTFSSDSAVSFSIQMDGSDNIHVTSRNPADNGQIYYHQFSIGTGGVVTSNVSSESVISENDPTGESSVVINSAGTVYTAVQTPNKVMGTVYENLSLYRRDGAASWTDLGVFVGNGSNNYGIPHAIVDASDNIHIAYNDSDGSNTLWNQWNGSAFAGEETITTTAFNGSAIINPSGNITVNVGQNLWERSGGTWSSDQFTSDAVSSGSLAEQNGQIYIFYVTGGDIRENHNTFGSFATADVTNVVTSSSTLAEVTTLWQQYNENGLGTAEDFLYYDSTNGDVYYGSLANPVTVGAAVSSIASSSLNPTAQETKTLSGTCTLSGSGVPAKLFVVDATNDTVLKEITANADGTWSTAVATGLTVHVAAQYDDGTDKWNDYSKPFLVT